MGYGNSPFVVIQHTDTEHDHVHIVASRIDVQGKVVSDFQSKMRAEAVMREVEREHNLVQVKRSHEIERAAPTRGELEELARTGERSTKMVLQDTIDRALGNEPSTTEFINQMERAGIHINPNVQSTGRVSGICFEHDGEVMKGSNLGRGYSWQGLQKRGLEYQEERDLPALKEAKAKYLEAELERGREAGLTREQIAGKEHEITELRQSLAIHSALAQEQEREQERTVSRGQEHQPATPEQSVEMPARSITAEVYPSVAAQSPVAELYRAASLEHWQSLSGEQSGRELWQSLNGMDGSVSGREVLARATGYDPTRSAAELMREAVQPAHERAAERERIAALEQQRALEESPAGRSMTDRDHNQELSERGEQERGRTAELTQSPEVETTKEIVQEIERERERVIGWDLSL
jgi:hypothetical protein